MALSTKGISKIDSLKLAEYVAFMCGSLSHLKLQKLLYYIEAHHLAYFETSLIDDDFEAWVHGPVSRKVYSSLKDHSVLYAELQYVLTEGEEHPEPYLNRTLTAEQVDLINEVIKEYGKLSSSQLEALTHSEEPWINARKGYAAADKCNKVMDKEFMAHYYKDSVYGY